MSRSDDERVADILEAADELALVVAVGALRILLAHHYHRIDIDQVWQIATVSVPELVRHLRPDCASGFQSAK